MENVIWIKNQHATRADSLVKQMENEEFCLKTLKKDDKSIRLPCNTNEILTIRVPKGDQNHSKPYKTNGKQANALAAGRRGPFVFVQSFFFLCAQKKAFGLAALIEFPGWRPELGCLI